MINSGGIEFFGGCRFAGFYLKWEDISSVFAEAGWVTYNGETSWIVALHVKCVTPFEDIPSNPNFKAVKNEDGGVSSFRYEMSSPNISAGDLMILIGKKKGEALIHPWD